MTREMLDFGGYPEIYADGVGEALFLGANLRIVMFAWRKVDGVLRRCVACHIIRPVDTVPPEVLPVWRRMGVAEGLAS